MPGNSGRTTRISPLRDSILSPDITLGESCLFETTLHSRSGSAKRAILHVGTHKTGTTAIQRTLAANTDYLAKYGIHWPMFGRGPAHHLLSTSTLERGFVPFVQRCYIRRKIVLAPQSCQTVVISSEKIYRMGFEFFERRPQNTRKNFQRRHDFLRRLRKVLTGFDVQVLIFLRRVDEFAESLFKELLFRKKYTGALDFTEFLDHQRPLFDYKTQIQTMSEHLGPVKVLSYEQACRDGLLRTFCHELGVDPPPDSRTGMYRIRPSPSNFAARFLMRLASECDLDFIKRNQILEFCLSNAWKDNYGSRSSSLWTSLKSRQSFLDEFADASLLEQFSDSVTEYTDCTLSENDYRDIRRLFERWLEDRNRCDSSSSRLSSFFPFREKNY